MANEDEDPVIAAVLLELSLEDEGLARQAEAALDWMTWRRGSGALTQDRVQQFLWYELPLKWMTPLDDKLEVTAALARALDLLHLPRYAAICRSEDTGRILGMYEQDAGKGLAAFHRANVASGIHPPDLPELEWGGTMRSDEAEAFTSTAQFLELAVAGGDLVPGARGWKSRQQELVRAHLSSPSEHLAGTTRLHAILTERVEWWLDSQRSETRRQLLASLANRLLSPVALPGEAANPFPPLYWLLERLGEGVPLTQTGNLGQKFVQAAASRFGWDLHGLPRTEDDLYDLHLVRHFAQRRLRLARRAGRRLVLTARGQNLLGNPEGLWRTVARGLLSDDAFVAFAGELCLAMLVDAASLPKGTIEATVQEAAAEACFRDASTGEPPTGRAIGWAVHECLNLCRAIGLLSVGGRWRDRGYGLTDLGKLTALEALRFRAVRPMSGAWG